MKKFIIGYFVGAILSSIATEYIVKQNIYTNFLEKRLKQ